jgi:hypothetical protein
MFLPLALSFRCATRIPPLSGLDISYRLFLSVCIF